MTNAEIEFKLDGLIAQERRTTREILQLVLLAEDRKLYLKRGQGSMVAWLVDRFKYSETAAQRRVQAARLLRAVPEVDAKIQTGEVNLTTLAKAQSVLRAEEKRTGHKVAVAQKAEVVQAIENQSLAKTERALAEMFPEAVEQNKRDHVRTVADGHVRMAISVPAEVYEILVELRDMLGHALPDAGFSKVIEKLARDHKKRKDPARVVRARKMPERATAAVSAKIRREVFHRDESRCQFKNPISGKICASRRLVEVDHIKPRALGGSDDIENLRCLCRAHNQFRAEKTFGKFKPSNAKVSRSHLGQESAAVG